MILYAFIAVGLGAAIGAWWRWGTGIMADSSIHELPLGTLSANLIGGFFKGYTMAFFMQHPEPFS